MKKIVIILFLFILSIAVLGQGLGIEEYFKKNPELKIQYYKDVYLQKINWKESTKEDYTEYVSDLFFKLYKKNYSSKLNIPDSIKYVEQIMSKNIIKKTIHKRINFLNYEKFNNIGIDLIKDILFTSTISNENDKKYSSKKFFNSLIIIKATVANKILSENSETIEIEGERKEIANYYVNYKMNIDEIIKGEYLIDKIPDFINVKSIYGGTTYKRDEVIFKRENRTELNIEEVRENNNDQVFQKGTELIIFFPTDCRLWYINKLIEGKLDIEMLNYLSSNNFDGSANKDISTFEELTTFFRNLEEINDTPNFYNRSYK